MKTCNEKEWDNFITKWIIKYVDDITNVDTHIERLVNKFERTCIIVNKKSGRTAIAKCHNLDRSDSNVGLAIAYARYRGQEIPRVVKE